MLKRIGIYVGMGAFILMLALAALVGCGQSDGADEANSTVDIKGSIGSGTCFIKCNQSFISGNCMIDFGFYITGEARSFWDNLDYEQCYLEIGDDLWEISITTCEIDDEALYEDYEYYYGYLIVEGELGESQGDAYLRVKSDISDDYARYPIGGMAVLEAYDDDGSFTQLVVGGVAMATDDAIFNYGIIMHCEVSEPVYIEEIELGLMDTGLSGDGIEIWTEEEYHSLIYEAISNSELDTYVVDVYEKKYVSEISSEMDICLDAGEYYIYVPIAVRDDDTWPVMRAALNISYRSEDNTYHRLVAGSFNLYSEMSRSLEQLNDMFNMD